MCPVGKAIGIPPGREPQRVTGSTLLCRLLPVLTAPLPPPEALSPRQSCRHLLPGSPAPRKASCAPSWWALPVLLWLVACPSCPFASVLLYPPANVWGTGFDVVSFPIIANPKAWCSSSSRNPMQSQQRMEMWTLPFLFLFPGALAFALDSFEDASSPWEASAVNPTTRCSAAGGGGVWTLRFPMSAPGGHQNNSSVLPWA